MKLSLPSEKIMEPLSQGGENGAASALPVDLLLSSFNSCSAKQVSDFDSFKIIVA